MSPQRRAQRRRLYALLDEVEMPIHEMAIRFVLSNADITLTLMGARSAEEVEANVAAAEKGPFGPELLLRLDEIAHMVPMRPYEEPFVLPFGRPYKGPGPATRR